MLGKRDLDIIESPKLDLKDNCNAKLTKCCCLHCDSTFKIYLGHTLSSWGDRMWGFAVGLYMAILYPDSLLLTAIYGFSNCLSGILFGPYIGAWIDRTQRITAARSSLVIQNSAVLLGATVLALTLHYRSDIKSVWNGNLEYVMYGVIILITVAAELASVANKIALEKDWIVVLAGGDERKLSTLNATMRTINLTTSILAPIVVSAIITYGSKVAGAVFIAIWNLISGVVEYNLLHQIYKMIPQLGGKTIGGGNDNGIPFIKIGSPESDSSSPRTGLATTVSANESNRPRGRIQMENNNAMMITPTDMKASSASAPQLLRSSARLGPNEDVSSSSSPETRSSLNGGLLTPGADFEDISLVTPQSLRKGNASQGFAGPVSNGNCNNRGSLSSSVLGDGGHATRPKKTQESSQDVSLRQVNGNTAWRGWKSYFSHHVKFAGLALACLYMTVLGFDIITTGFVYSQGVNESFIGILTAIGAVFGILGSVSFPLLRRKLGKNRAGILGFSLESLCLLLCVGSIFASGSPFEPKAIADRFDNISGTSSASTADGNHESLSLQQIMKNKANVIFLMAGIILARYGLWLADLSVTQIFQEEVEESQRGVINGVQDSLNKFMDLLKFALVILLPSPETFGYLIILSWAFVFFGTILFLVFTRIDSKRRRRVANSNFIHQQSPPLATVSGNMKHIELRNIQT